MPMVVTPTWEFCLSFEVGTERFDSLLNKITSTASVLDGGSKIVDKSALYHGHAEKIFDSEFAKWTVGSNLDFTLRNLKDHYLATPMG